PASARDERGYLHVDEYLRFAGQDRVFAIGDIADADRDQAGIAGRQAEVVAANIRVMITGEGELTAYEGKPVMVVIPLGPEGGASQLVDAIHGADFTAQVKGRAMLIDSLVASFTA